MMACHPAAALGACRSRRLFRQLDSSRTMAENLAERHSNMDDKERHEDTYGESLGGGWILAIMLAWTERRVPNRRR